MNNILKTIEIDLYSPTCYEVIKAQQGDHNSRIVQFILYEQGKPYTIKDHVACYFTGCRGNGSPFFKNDCISSEENRITITLKNDILCYPGTIEAKIILYDNTSQSVLSTVPFKITCIKSPYQESDLTEYETSIITDLIFQVQKSNQETEKAVQQAAESADTAISNAQAAAASAQAAKISQANAEASDVSSLAASSNAASSAALASAMADESAENAKTARSYTKGDTGLRQNESMDNAEYYYSQSKEIYDTLSQAGTVTGVKGNAQTEYQSGFVNLTPEHIGALPSSMKNTINNSYQRANASYNQANSAYSQANAAYNQANLAYLKLIGDNLCLGNNAYTGGAYETVIGGYAYARGNDSTAIGYGAHAGEFEATALGSRAHADAIYSTAVGTMANASGNHAMALGYNASGRGENSTALGYAAYTSNQNSIQLGSNTLSSITARVSITPQSDKRDKTDIEDISNSAVDFLNKVRAVRYVFNNRELYIDEENLSEEEQEKRAKFGLCAYDKAAHAAGTKKRNRQRIGVLAQEVQHALAETYGTSSYVNLVNDNLFDFDPEEIPDDVENQLAVNYEGFIPFLIKAVQELDARVRTLEASREELLPKEGTPNE